MTVDWLAVKTNTGLCAVSASVRFCSTPAKNDKTRGKREASRPPYVASVFYFGFMNCVGCLRERDRGLSLSALDL